MHFEMGVPVRGVSMKNLGFSCSLETQSIEISSYQTSPVAIWLIPKKQPIRPPRRLGNRRREL